MENGISLALTKCLFDFDKMLGEAIVAVPSKKLSLLEDPIEDKLWKFQVGKHVLINCENETDTQEDEFGISCFWVGFGWEEKDKHETCIWLEFDAKTSPAKIWDKANTLVGSSGKYYSGVDFEFSKAYMNAWIHFYLKDEYLQHFYNNAVAIQEQQAILTGFIDEVISKL